MGCTKGFEIVDLETLDTQALLDSSDVPLDFVQKWEDVRPMAIFRVDNEFILCYYSEHPSFRIWVESPLTFRSESAFYTNKSGWRVQGYFIVYWEGHPRSFALHYPYVLAFEPTFVEVRHVETVRMTQIMYSKPKLGSIGLLFGPW